MTETHGMSLIIELSRQVNCEGLVFELSDPESVNDAVNANNVIAAAAATAAAATPRPKYAQPRAFVCKTEAKNRASHLVFPAIGEFFMA
ncbi:unnamed protein product [Hydatigera taeniaeformis]|uniref:Uncharacterized protein n=1 Tax=Hydatigena taeniaeformis TaxID=6205 RepID=A0A0R3WKW6_HYDTA|nr:unnamed protein product [Hydatigera taeniaeformis]